MSYTFRGSWYLPNKPELSVGGELTLTAGEDISLKLYGKFNSGVIPAKFDYVHGRTVEGKHITLFNVYEVQYSSNSIGASVSTFISELAFVGALFDIESDVVFSSLAFELGGLHEWLGISGFDKDWENDNVVLPIRNYKQPTSIEVSLEKGKAYYFEFTSNVTFKKNIQVVQESVFAGVSVSEPIGLKELHSELGIFLTFIYVAMGGSASYKRIHAYSIEWESNVEIFYKHKYFNNSRERGRFEFLFSYKDIKNEFETLIRDWYCQRKAHDIPLKLLFDNDGSSEFDESRFISVVQAIETYHRRTTNDNNDDKKKRIRDILSVLNKDDAQWLNEMVNRGPKLADRLTSLFRPIKEEVERISEDSLENLVRNTVKSRNYYTHYNSDKSDGIVSIRNLPRFTRVLKCIMILVVLKDFKFPFEVILDITAKVYHHFSAKFTTDMDLL
jgi:hypothetical protein